MSKLPTFFTDEVASIKEGTKGRSGRLIQLRNEAMCDRFYYYQKVKSYHYAKVVDELHNEFFISQTEITKILGRMHDYLGQLRANRPELKELRRRWPWYVWD